MAEALSEEDIFSAAMEKPTPQARAAYLGQACGDDTQLRERVEQLLRLHDGASHFLEHPASIPNAAAELGQRIGPYKLLELLGEGGMGAVYLAEQREPVRRLVALKLIKPGLSSRLVLARFEAERQALALMDHPNIARVLDAGTTNTAHGPPTVDLGRPYFVMELVKGVPITRYCDTYELPVNERLELFRVVCLGVHHAHQKGVIHRDIKPANVLVAAYDGNPVPKIIDFGVAKAISERLTENTLYTQVGQVIGTLDYMSPEQAEFNARDVDTRSDIYSLGVLLYELLTGTTPLRSDLDRQTPYLEVLRRIREEEAQSPSTRLATLETLPAVAAQRRLEPRRLTRLMHRELNWIVLKALAKERDRRYESAAAFAEDVRRYLTDQPIQARAVTPGDRVWRWCRRNKLVASLTSAILLLLLSLAIGSSLTAFMLNHEQHATHDELTLKIAAEGKARRRLFESLLAQSQASRRTGLVGQRYNSLELLMEALKLNPGIELAAEDRLRVRSEAIACLALPDFQFMENLQVQPTGSGTSFTQELDKMARVESDGSFSIRRPSDGAELQRLTGPGTLSWPRFIGNDRFIIAQASPKSGQVGVLWDRLSGPDPSPLLLPDRFQASEVSPDGRLLAMSYLDGTVGLFDLTIGKEKARLGKGAEVCGLVFHASGRFVAVARNNDKVVEVLDLNDGTTVFRWPLDSSPVSVAWSSDGRLLAVGCHDYRIMVRDLLDDRVLSVLDAHYNEVTGLRFITNTHLLLSSSWDGSTRLWDAVAGKELVRAVGATAAFGREEKQIVLETQKSFSRWQVVAPRECRTFSHGFLGNRSTRPDGWIYSVRFSPDGRFLATTSAEEVYLWRLDAPGDPCRLRLPYSFDGSFLPDGKGLITFGWTGLIRWPFSQTEQGGWLVGPPERLADGPRTSIGRVHVPEAGIPNRLAYVDEANDQAVCRSITGPAREVRTKRHPGMRHVTLSPDGKWLATGTWNGRNLKVWDAESGEEVRSFACDHSMAKFSLDGQWLVGSFAGTYRLWRTGSWDGAGVISVEDGPGGVGLFAFSRDGKALAVSCFQNQRIKLVTVPGLKEIATIESSDSSGINDIAFDATDSRLAVARLNQAEVWDLAAIRGKLALMELDWDEPPPPSHDSPPEVDNAAQGPRAAGSETTILLNDLHALRRAAQAEPENGNACNSLAWAHVMAPEPFRDLQEALDYAQRAMQIKPQPSTRNTLGAVAYRLGRYREALETLLPNLKDQPRDQTICDLLFLAMSCQKLGNTAQAADYLQQARDIWNEHKQRNWSGLAWMSILEESQLLEEAEAVASPLKGK